MLEELGIPVKLTLKWDNTAAITIATLEAAWRSRHFGVRALALKEQVESGTLEIVYVDTKNQDADCLTKCLPGPVLSAFLSRYYAGVR